MKSGAKCTNWGSLGTLGVTQGQENPVNVKHGIRCAMDKVGGGREKPRGVILTYCYIS